jgi:cell division transport system ATP-binding protein
MEQSGSKRAFAPALRQGVRFDPLAAGRPVLTFEGVHKAYRTDAPVLRGLNLEIARGEFVFITGPSGAGKSTLLRLLYAEESVDAGRILFLGREIGRLTSSSIPFLRRNVGVVFQDFKLVKNWSVIENVALPLEVLGLPARTIRQRVGAVLERVGLGGRGSEEVGHLSGGEQQRVAIARAVVSEPALLLADEPTGNLSQKAGLEVMQILRRSVDEDGRSVLLVTHNPRDACFADRLLFLVDGEIAPGVALRGPNLAVDDVHAALAKLAI